MRAGKFSFNHVNARPGATLRVHPFNPRRGKRKVQVLNFSNLYREIKLASKNHDIKRVKKFPNGKPFACIRAENSPCQNAYLPDRYREEKTILNRTKKNTENMINDNYYLNIYVLLRQQS